MTIIVFAAPYGELPTVVFIRRRGAALPHLVRPLRVESGFLVPTVHGGRVDASGRRDGEEPDHVAATSPSPRVSMRTGLPNPVSVVSN